MKKNLIILLLFPVFINGQKLEFSGYFENQLFPQKIKGEIKITDYNKLRLNLFSEVSDNVNFSADYVYRTYHGATSYNAFDFMPQSTVNSYAAMFGVNQDSLRPLFKIDQKDENFLDNAYVTIYTDNFNLRIGKQQLPWGSGYTWNPTDVFHDKNVIDPTYEKTGVNALKLEIPYSSEGNITGVLSYADDWKKTTKALKLHQVISDFDVSLSYVEKYQSSTDYYTFTETTEKRQAAGVSFSTQLLGLGFWAEGAYNIMESSKNYGQYLIGFDYTFESGLYLVTELYRNELGKSDYKNYQFSDWMRLLSAQGENLGRDYVFAGESYPLTELLNWSNYLLVNANDGSLVFFPWFDYSFGDNTEINVVGYIPLGKADTEFGEFGAGGFARIRVYF
jgi:hypothetical protein